MTNANNASEFNEYVSEKIKQIFIGNSIDLEYRNHVGEFVYQFSTIISLFKIKNIKEVTDFIIINDDLVDLLLASELIIRKFFPYEELILEYVPDPEINLNQLVIYIQTPISESNIGKLNDDLHKIDKEILHLLNDNTRNKFLIDLASK